MPEPQDRRTFTKPSRTPVTSRRSLLLAAGALPAATLLPQACASPSAAMAPQNPSPYVAVPDRARPPKLPPSGYLVDDLGGGLYGFRNGGMQSMFLVTRTGVVVIDAGRRSAEHVMAAIRGVTDRPVTHFIYSHSHNDHVGGASFFGDKVRYVAHELTAEKLKKAKDPGRPVPDITFSGSRHVLNVGGKRLILEYHGNIHQEGNIFIFAPEQKTLMLVDVIAPRWAPYFELGLAHYVPLYFDVVNKIIPGYDFETFTGGHGGWYGTRADIEEYGRYLSDLESATREATREVREDPNVGEGIDPENIWAQSQVYYNEIADRAAKRMPTSWLTRLGGADVFLRENTHAMAYSVGLDNLR
ncbi:MBL fold metallo-hydrolase [Allokutzneria sp. A3M-2-11 16]|uniref:MBL fold metallo-hydrolase n=1 Tax=Allokutzneria sp. A3M-2-11 16 TaxID=2962043 RepID=UPI0020B65F14|nr:MBL fold metallo-hydrolase [Allokutzneria sp. A3M-2-11 16]MCP3803413.1 MBL fold metallo-hydrolase [Allokutzneria sp. A3M-2-11 16]